MWWRPSARRPPSASYAAGVLRFRATRPTDPAQYGRAAQLRSLYWSIAIAVVFVGASFLVNKLLTS